MCTYHFEELTIPGLGEGMLLYGKAELAAGDERYSDEFVVDAIQVGDKWLSRSTHNGGGTFEQMLFYAIEKVLYDEKTVHGREAAIEWGDFVEGNTPAVPLFKRRAGLAALVGAY
ncbi:hypothetical protein [Rhizobium sp. S163]|uniref:hypothetical protein n=1 Tax=Rhizobium sp. S163 TaxID=3055039 RepID=UPI0025AA2445|nr:hypothetical protein [Rhizobium sp. S163]MDM9643848.1 hypothetical protein [Rhizobium sp. S163]